MEDTNLLTQSLKSHEIYLKIVDDSLQNLEDFSERLQLRLKCDDVDNHCMVEFCQGNYPLCYSYLHFANSYMHSVQDLCICCGYLASMVKLCFNGKLIQLVSKA